MEQMEYYLDELQILAESYGISGIRLSDLVLAVLAATVVTGLLLCFFGLKLVRLLGAILGFVIGSAAGAAAGTALGQNGEVVLIIAGVAGLVFAVLCAVFRKLSVFLVSMASAAGICAAVLAPQDLVSVLICAGAGLILAVLALKFTEPVVMVLTGIAGALVAGQEASLIPGVDSLLLQNAVIAALAVAGICIQFLMESGRRKRRNLKKAAEIRQHNSTANVVERARAVMEDLDDLDDLPEDTETDGSEAEPEEADITFLDIDETEEGEDGEEPEDAEDDILFLDDEEEEDR